MKAKTNGGFLVSQIKQVQGRVFERLLDRQGVVAFNGAQGRILYVLWQQSPLPITELAHRTGLAKTTLTGMLDRLEASGHIRRTGDSADRRRVDIHLTEAARGLQGDYDAVSETMNGIFYKGFTDAEVAALEAALGRVLQNLYDWEA